MHSHWHTSTIGAVTLRIQLRCASAAHPLRIRCHHFRGVKTTLLNYGRHPILECPGKPYLLPVCQLICQVFLFLCQQIWFQPIFHFSSFSVPEVVCCLLICCVFFCFFFSGGDTQKSYTATTKKSYTPTPKKSYTATPKKSYTASPKNRSSDTAESGIAECARETAIHSFKRRSDPTNGCQVMEFYKPMISRRGTILPLELRFVGARAAIPKEYPKYVN